MGKGREIRRGWEIGRGRGRGRKIGLNGFQFERTVITPVANAHTEPRPSVTRSHDDANRKDLQK